ncbi:MAG: fibronectin type III domain-containing protein [Thermoplasmata archaeon]|nr:fibronectin type III domain-containing protein [Thermoplasmata archaeon]
MPDLPSGLHVTTVSATSISLAWTLPAAGFDNVSLEYHRQHPGTTNTTVSMGGPLSAFTVGSLAPNSTYLFTIATWNLTVGSGYLPFVNGTTTANATSQGAPAGCGLACSPLVLAVGILALGVILGVVGTALVARRRWRPPPP